MSSNSIKAILYTSDLVNYDARSVFKLAVDHAVAHNAKLIFLNVVEPIGSSTKLYLSNYLSDDQLDNICQEQVDSVREEISKRVRDFCHEELIDNRILSPVNIQIEVAFGKPEDMIVECANDNQADMIVMGTRVHSRLGGLLHHSIAHQVMVHAKCPVLISHI